MKKMNFRVLKYSLIVFCILSLCYILLTYTIGKQIDSLNYNLEYYSNYILPTLIIGILFYVYFGFIILYGNKKEEDIEFVLKGCLIFIIAISIIIIGVQASNIQSFKNNFNWIIKAHGFTQSQVDSIKKQSNINFYLPQCYLLAVEVVQIIWAGVMLFIAFQSKEQWRKVQELRLK